MRERVHLLESEQLPCDCGKYLPTSISVNYFDSDAQKTSLAALSFAVGSFLVGFIMDRFGRKRTLQIQCVPNFIGWILLALSTEVHTLYIGRLLTGLGGGMVDCTIQVYISEITTPHLRNFLASTPSLIFSMGMLSVYTMGAFHLQWNLIAAICAVVPLLHFMVLIFLPESPVWLQGQISDETSSKSPCDSAWKSLISRHTRRPLLILVVFFFFQQFCGMNAVIFYAVQIFQSAEGGILTDDQSAVVIGAARLVVICVSCAILSRVGRRPVSIISGIGMALSMLTLGTVIHLQGKPPLAASLTCMTGFIAFNTFGFFAIPWVMLGELLPERCRGLASGIISAIVYIYIFIVVKSYPYMLTLLGEGSVFLIFGMISILGTAFVHCFLPETKGKTLLEIEESLRK
ncbi:facilitated trehalose transporter Tret1-like isoform X2 [Neocloeon triangulifer]|uniref:facilitated trehalose transporter Tret1-like isoform X2 n=1 Tax=Neocloeon triangulifer TaxID=2078957 RepID=UPI00286EEB06|nr:facilitated trehalose transporter Tret1-like isoform X2 [Neocloeon triangulifer]